MLGFESQATFFVVCNDVICWHATLYVHTMAYTIWTYYIVCHVHTTWYVHFQHTTLYTICWDENVPCCMCHIRCTTYYFVCWHTTLYVHTMSYMIWTYDIVCQEHTTLYVHFQHTTLYTICRDENIRCRMCHIRCRMLTYDTSHVQCRKSISCILHVWHCTYDVQHDVVCCTYDVVRAWRTTSYVTYDIVGGKNPDDCLELLRMSLLRIT